MENDDEQVTSSSQNPDHWVRLISADGYTFLLKRKVAMISGTLKNMLSSESNFYEAASNTCPVNERAIVVEKLCEYLSYKHHYRTVAPKEEIPDFLERIAPEVALELLMAADYYEA